MTFAKTARLLLSYVVEATAIGASDPCAARFRTARTIALLTDQPDDPTFVHCRIGSTRKPTLSRIVVGETVMGHRSDLDGHHRALSRQIPALTIGPTEWVAQDNGQHEQGVRICSHRGKPVCVRAVGEILDPPGRIERDASARQRAIDIRDLERVLAHILGDHGVVSRAVRARQILGAGLVDRDVEGVDTRSGGPGRGLGRFPGINIPTAQTIGRK